MHHLKNRIKHYKRLCNILLATLIITGYIGVILPLGYMDRGEIKFITFACWGIAGFACIGLQMLICNHFDRLKLLYERKYDRLMAKQPKIYSVNYTQEKDMLSNEIRSA